MNKDEIRLALAKARRRQRTAEREIIRIKEESRSYRRLGFGQDIKDIQLLALQDQRIRSQAEVRRYMRSLGIAAPSSPDLQSWLLLPFALLLDKLANLNLFQTRVPVPADRRTLPSERAIRY